MYRIDYGTYPESLNGDYRQKSDESIALLYPLYLEAVDTFDCPGGNSARAEYIDDPADYRMLGDRPIIVGADYTQDDIIPLDSSAGRIVMADRHDDGPNHKVAANCLFKDGHVEVTAGMASHTDFPNPEYPDSDPRIYHYDGDVDKDGDGYYTASLGVDDAHLEGEVDADDTDPNVR